MSYSIVSDEYLRDCIGHVHRMSEKEEEAERGRQRGRDRRRDGR